ncbi:hypothetical protein [Sulfitobacter sp. S190]|uniref:hypothetical protein n=1 Tax=Sulfitobacter sp. S190 TaxID=2867022 RepID=UPI0021A2ECA6|nr:hypothetical protein [Sulfitobacter sp. S190]UWR24575.1 hypothetical protein K3756_19300 [Sulfitobacter sp. S190]
MKSIFGLSALLIAVTAYPAQAERNLVPSMDSVSDICPDRPVEPQWMQDIGVRDAYQRVLVQDIYRAQSLARIVEAGECNCAIRFPPWDNAETEFFERFANSERWEMLEASDAYGREANALRPQAMAICEAEGNW